MSVFGTMMDEAETQIIALKKQRDELQERNTELKQARATADHANHAKSDFLASMSHELRSPLNAILGFAQLLESDSPPPSPSQKESVTRILKAGWHLLGSSILATSNKVTCTDTWIPTNTIRFYRVGLTTP